MDNDRGISAGEAAERLRNLPVGWELKRLLAGIAVAPKYVCGAENHGVTKTATDKLQRQLELAIRGPLASRSVCRDPLDLQAQRGPRGP